MQHLRPATHRVLAIPATACLLFAPACEGPAADGGSEAWSVADAPEVEIGEVDGAEPYLFQSIRSARFLPDGRIVVADGGLPALRVFGPDGEFRTEIGGEGEGPGEFRSIFGLWLTPGGDIAVWDRDNVRITTFSPEGELEGTSRVRPGGEMPDGNLEVFFGTFRDGDVVLATLDFGGEPGGSEVVPDPYTLGRFDGGGDLRGLLGEVRGMRRVARNPVPFSPMPHTVVGADSIYVADGYQAKIDVWDGAGAPVRTIELPEPAVSYDDPWASLEEELRGRDDGRSGLFVGYLEEGLVQRDDSIPRIAGLLADDRGFLWVKTYDPLDDSLWLKGGSAGRPAPGGHWRVVRPDGEVEATVRMPDGVIPLEVRGDRLLGVARDEMEVERVVVHRIER